MGREESGAALGIGKPKLRGVSHAVASFVAIAAGFWLWNAAPTEEGQKGSVVFTFSLVFLFSVSGIYHVINWRPEARKWWRRLDHAAIFVVIAGTYTPVCLLALGEDLRARLLAIIWTGAGLGILQSLFWVNLAKPITACLYLGLGWIGVQYRREIAEKTSFEWCSLIIYGGLSYTIGTIIYVVRRPNPFPKFFGYHEIFHVFVILAALLHFKAVAWLTLNPPSPAH